MYRVKIKSGGSILVLSPKEMPVEKELNFTEEEYKFAKRLSAALHESEERLAFWRTLLYKKTDINYSLYSDFPEVKTEATDIASGICNMLRKKIAS